MRFLYLAIHHPRPDHVEDLLTAMRKLGHAMGAADGLIEATAWKEKDGKRIVATSAWESEAAFREAGPVIGAAIKDVPFSDWEEKPRELFRLVELE